ncbi:MAG: peptide-methionine (S)-S-oxide reductase MsrA [Phycisphaeraceae bacterium]
MLLSFAGFACSRTDTNPAEVPAPKNDEALVEREAPASQQDPAEAAPQTKQIVLAGGCFWCVEAVYEELDGVLDVESGYAGGDAATANYNAVKTGRTKHAEVARITYDPSKITLGTIYRVFFSTAHDPTTLNRQGFDVGPQYRSAIFYATPEQKKIAEDYIKQLDAEGIYQSPIVTTLEPLEKFYPAEDYHQDYARRNPNDGYINNVSTPKVKKTKQAFPELLKDKD